MKTELIRCDHILNNGDEPHRRIYIGESRAVVLCKACFAAVTAEIIQTMLNQAVKELVKGVVGLS